MLPFLQSLLLPDPAQAAETADLCLDYELIADRHPKKFQEIAGLELFPNLEALSIVNHDLAQASGLAHLHQLHTLNLSHNILQTLGEIAALRSLHWLDVSHNELENLDGIEALSQLTELQAGFNLFSDLGPLGQIPKLKTLVVNGNRYLKDLNGLPSGLEALHVGKCILHDYEGLRTLPRLQQLTLSPGSMAQLALLTDLPALTELHLQATRMHGHVRIPPMRGLRLLKITKGQMINALTLPQTFDSLLSLQVIHTPLNSPPDLRHCPQLQSLAIHYAPLQNLAGLAELPHLKYLCLEGSAIPQQDLLALRRLKPSLEIVF